MMDYGNSKSMSIKLFIHTALLFCLLLSPTQSVKHGDFKTCDQSGFCKRGRDRSIRAVSAEFSSTWKSPYLIQELPTWSTNDNALHATLVNELYPGIKFGLNVSIIDGSEGNLRIKLDEINGLRQRYNEADKWTLVSQPKLLTSKDINLQIEKDKTSMSWTGAKVSEFRFELQYHPLLITLFKDGQPHVVLNERGLFNMEHFRTKSPQTPQDNADLVIQESGDGQVINSLDHLYPGFKETSEDGMWEEDFGGRTDHKPKGPESLALDITFPGYSHVFGIPEHASPLSLKSTRGAPENSPKDAYTDPYRLWNLDVFEYEHDSEMALYGAIPLMKAHRAGSTVGVFWLNAAETWIDVEKRPTKPQVMETWSKASLSDTQTSDLGPTDTTTETYWMSESGILDLFIFLGPSSQDIFSSFGALVGTTIMPPYFSIAYHQCRWNYVNQEDLLSVLHNFDKHNIPLDVLWLDIEYAEEHKYFIWDKKNFPEPMKMINQLEATGRKLVTIVDPHIKRTQDLYVYKEAVELNVLSKLPDGSEYEGWCWTGSSSWVDYFNPASWDWWSGLFKFDKYQESTVNVHNWLDMNEPSVFNAPEITMPRDNVHYGGWEHRDLHNLNGMASHNHSVRGLRERTDPPMRGFVLSRSFFAGTQRYGAIWQGDNMGTWEHLAVSIPMLLSNGIAGMAFNGADVGGFFGNPSHELLVRWYQAGAFFPFFRAHAHIDTKRREPYLFDEPIRSYIVDMIKLRYTLLPSWYTLFFENTFTGSPMAVPQYVMFPKDPFGFAIDDQFYLGSSGLLVKPITQKGVTSTDIYIADYQPYYNYFTWDMFMVAQDKPSSKRFSFSAPLDTLPLFLRGGHIVTRRDLVRRAAPLMWKDPITLVVALDKDGKSNGTLYLDDGESFNHERGQFVYRKFSVSRENLDSFSLSCSDAVPETLRSTHQSLRQQALDQYQPKNEWAKKISSVLVDKVIILGLPARPTCVKISGSSNGLSYEYKAGLASTVKSAIGKQASVLKIKNAGVRVTDDWSIEVEFKKSCSVDPSTVELDLLTKFQSDQCPKGYFQCKNVGHFPSCISISRVNDGICEPECCDGSDESQNQDIKCPNRCEADGAAYQKKLQKLLEKFKVGNSERKNYILFGKKEENRLIELKKTLTNEILDLEKKESIAKFELDRIEKESQVQISKLKNTNLFRKITSYQNSIKQLKSKNDQLQRDLDQLNDILKDLKAGYNPNYQDMVVKGAVKGYEEWEAEKEKTPETEEKNEDVISIPSNEELDGLANEDPINLITDYQASLGNGFKSADSTTMFNLEQYIPESFRSSYEKIRESLLYALSKCGISTSTNSNQASEDGDISERPAVAKAKNQLQDAQNLLSSAQNQLKDVGSKLEQDWGRDWEFKRLDQTCLEINHAEYIYEVCLFGEAFQKTASGSRTSLGHFAHWNTDAPEGSSAYYSKQFYTNGAKCWNGPERSLALDLKCGTKNVIYSIMEPEKCEYLMKMSTPAACHDGLEQASSTPNNNNQQNSGGDQLDDWVVLRDEL